GDRSYRVLLQKRIPRIGLELLQSERDLLLVLVDIQNLAVDDLPEGNDLRGMLDRLGPGHLRDMDEPLDPMLDLDECAVVGEGDDLPLYDLPFDDLLVDGIPRVWRELLQAERDTLPLLIVVEDDNLDILIELDNLRRMVD